MLPLRRQYRPLRGTARLEDRARHGQLRVEEEVSKIYTYHILQDG